ncbi:MAG: serine hydrolase [Bacteroides sp.]|nr:serine hydrolase [Bacteroides sp.]
MYHKITAKEIAASDRPFRFPQGESKNLPEEFSFEGKSYKSSEYLESSFTKGFLVIQDGSLVHEKYYSGHSESTQHISWSMAKSVVSALFGIAMEEGYIQSVDQTVDSYLPELIGSGYEGVRIKDVLQMSSGVKFNENYRAFMSDINKWGRSFAFGRSQNKFASTLVREEEPGTHLHYVSINTHVLGMIIVKVTGKSLSEYLEEKLWKPLGMEYNAYWLCDDSGMEVALGGLNIALRDYAKIGQLFLNQGKWQGEQILPREWALASVTPDARHLMPENNKIFGYGYQWWIPQGKEGEYMAMGVYNQYTYVNPTRRTVIVVNSANHRFNEKENPYANPKVILELFRAIAHQTTP